MSRLLVGLAFLLASCAAPATPGTTAPVGVTPTTAASTTTTAVPATTTTTLLRAGDGPAYLTYGPAGVYRYAGGQSTMVLDRPVMWAADDGAGGIVFYAEPGILERLAAGTASPVVLARDASPNFAAVVDGRLTIVVSLKTNSDCDDADTWHSALIDPATGAVEIYVPCIPLESYGVHPQSMGGSLVLSVANAAGIEMVPVISLTFRDLSAAPVTVAAHPRPEPCSVCAVSARLAPDGTTVAVAEDLPEPSHLGADSWDAFFALSEQEQWRRWEAYRANASHTTIRVFDLTSGATTFSTAADGAVVLDAFDGRYICYELYPDGPDGPLTEYLHLLDTATGEEVEIVWGGGLPEGGPAGLALVYSIPPAE